MTRILVAAYFLIACVGTLPVFAQSQSLSKLQQNRGETTDANAGPPIVFNCDLLPDEESAVTESPGSGHVEFTLERATLKLSWKLTYTSLTSSPTGVQIHGPQVPGSEAGVLVDLAPKGGSLKSPIEGSAILNEGNLEYLLTGRMYVNVHTVKFPAGELRGQLARQRPKSPNS